MGQLIDGKWVGEGVDLSRAKDGSYIRRQSQFRDWITADGSSGFKAESGRYHLYVSLACPWAHRTLIFRELKGLADHISVSVVDPFLQDQGWEFNPAESLEDHLFGSDYVYQLYQRADSDYTGRVTVPVLWDRETNTIVNNESAEIIRMFNHAFDEEGAHGPDFYPTALRNEIDAINDFVYPNVNNGVYRCGFAASQAAYEKAFENLFGALDNLDHRLSNQPWLVGDTLTEADWRLFTTLIRFDPVYVGHFKCNRRRIADYTHLQDYLRALFQYPGVKETVNMRHIKEHYYRSHIQINPTGVVPVGPELDLEGPHSRN